MDGPDASIETTPTVELGEEDRALVLAAARRVTDAHRVLGEEVVRHRRAVAEYEARARRATDQVHAIAQALLEKYIPDGHPTDWTFVAEEARFIYNPDTGVPEP